MATTKQRKMSKVKPKAAQSKPPAAKAKKVARARTQKTKPTQKRIKKQTSAKRISPVSWLVLALAGFALSLLAIFFYFYSQTVLSFKVSPTVVGPAHLRNAYPVNIAIENVGIDVSIIPANIKDGIWQMSDNSATYLENSARPAEGGNVIIYAHNKKQLFAPLHQIKVGNSIVLTTANGTNYEYKVEEIKVVDPSAIEEVVPTNYEVLTVYTCTGLFDSKRLIVKASPTRVETL